MSTYFITGATSGLGHQVALRLAKLGVHRLVLPIRETSRGAGLRRAMTAAGAVHVSTPTMDLSSLQSVAAFLESFKENSDTTFDGLLFNAGGQSFQQMEFTVDGIETTFAVNHLAHHFLLEGLLDRLAPGARVGWTASGVHDPELTSARLFGFRGPQYISADRLAKGDFEDGISMAQACRDAYATSKLCNVVSARAFAGRRPRAATFFSFDPGLMPGTGLARKYTPALQWINRVILPRLAWILPGTSTTAKSGAVLANLLTGRLAISYNGAYFNYTGASLQPAAQATERWVADDLMASSDALLAPFAELSLKLTEAAPARKGVRVLNDRALAL